MLKSDYTTSVLGTALPHGLTLPRETGLVLGTPGPEPLQSTPHQAPATSPPYPRPTHPLGSSSLLRLGCLLYWRLIVLDRSRLSRVTGRDFEGFFGPCPSGGSRGMVSTYPSLGQSHTSRACFALVPWSYRKQGRVPDGFGWSQNFSNTA